MVQLQTVVMYNFCYSLVEENSFKVGSLVYKSNTFNRKLDAPWSGPFVIVGILSPVVYKIRYQRITEVVHHDRLKLYHSSIPLGVGYFGMQPSTHLYIGPSLFCSCSQNF
jgi:hypothetical protein